MITYDQWNEWIARYCFVDGPGSNRDIAYLAIEEEDLKKIQERYYSEELITPNGITTRSVVEALIRKHPYFKTRRMCDFFKAGARDSQGYPTQIAFLAILVLAAQKMGEGSDLSSNNYFAYLNEVFEKDLFYLLLANNLSINNAHRKIRQLHKETGAPNWFITELHRKLWEDLQSWVEHEQKKVFILPPEEERSGSWCNVHFILCHSLLRKADLKKLPCFFEWAGFHADDSPSLLLLDNQLHSWLKVNPHDFTHHGCRVLERTEATHDVLWQIRTELQHWDGLVPQKVHGGIAKEKNHHITARIYLCNMERGWFQAYYYFQCPENDDVTEKFEPFGDGYYGFKYEEARDCQEFAVSKSSGISVRTNAVPHIFLLKKNEDGDFLEANHFFLNDTILVVSTKQITEKWLVEFYLSRLNGGEIPPAYPKTAKGLPQGWTILSRFEIVSLPKGGKLEAKFLFGYEVLWFQAGYQIRFSGGLKLDRRTWLSGAAPQVCFAGEQLPPKVTINDNSISIENGIISSRNFQEPAVYIIKYDEHHIERIKVEAFPTRCVNINFVDSDATLPVFKYERENHNVYPNWGNDLSDEALPQEVYTVSGALVSGNVDELPPLIQNKTASAKELTQQERNEIWLKIYPDIIRKNRPGSYLSMQELPHLLEKAIGDPILFALIKRNCNSDTKKVIGHILNKRETK